MKAPFSQEAEWSVVGQMLANPTKVAEGIGQQIELDDFYRPDVRLIFEAIVQSYFADEPVDPVVIGDRLSGPLSAQWGCPPEEVPQRLYQQASARKHMDNLSDHAKLVKTHSTNRRILSLCEAVQQRIETGEYSPQEIGDFMTTEASKVTTGTKAREEIVAHIDVGREYVRYLQRLKAAKEQGVELAVYTGLQFVDRKTRGLAPSELMLVGGPPGVGKSAITWAMAEGFARRQMVRPKERRVATLVLSLEMSLYGSSSRLATASTGIDGHKLREGDLSKDELSSIISHWRNDAELPLYWNFASNFKMSQMRALIVEAIRRHNVGLVVVDHFRMFDPDRRINNANQEDEAKARFLKEDIAKELNVAVLCLAHTIKLSREINEGRPTLNDLRGSGQVAAHCDIVAFMHVPFLTASQAEQDEGHLDKTDAELIFRKNRSGELGASKFKFRPARMEVSD